MNGGAVPAATAAATADAAATAAASSASSPRSPKPSSKSRRRSSIGSRAELGSDPRRDGGGQFGVLAQQRAQPFEPAVGVRRRQRLGAPVGGERRA